jgi:hypothetical protein
VIRRLALLVPLALTTPLLLIPAAATAGPPDPTTLPVGAAPAVTWQSGTKVHTAGGKTVALPFGKAGNSYEVLGKRGGEWIVLTPRYRARVLAVKGTRVRTVWDHSDHETYTNYTLSQGGALVAEWNYESGGKSNAMVFDLTGKVVARKRWSGYVNPLDFDGDTMLISNHTTTWTWTVPGKPVAVAPGAVYGDLASDLLFVNFASSDSVGPTSISSPVTPTWTTLDFQPVRLSPDRQYVAGVNFDVKNVIEVRNVSDGTVLPLPRYKIAADAPMTWQPDGSLLFATEQGPKEAVVHCTLAGACDRATKWLKGRHLGFPG